MPRRMQATKRRSSVRPAEDDAGRGAKPQARGRKSAKKRDAIIRAAIEVINDKTFALATMADIAASLDLRDATLYYYFPNKQALVYQCHVSSLERFERLLTAADQNGDSGIAKVRLLIQGLLEDSQANGPQLYFGDYSYLEALQRENIDVWARRMTRTLEGFITDGMRDRSIVQCDPRLVVQLLLGMLIWLAKWTPAVKGLTVEELMGAITAFSFHGLESRDQSQP